MIPTRTPSRSFTAGMAALLVLVPLAGAACGGKVFLDQNAGAGGAGGTGGFGGNAAVVNGTGVSSTTTTVSTTVSSTTVVSSTGTGGDPCGSLPFQTSPQCAACSKSSCCGEVAKCSPGTACAGLIICQKACGFGQVECLEKCENTFPNGQEDETTMYFCLMDQCGPECAFDVCGGSATMFDASCAMCFEANCCGALTFCMDDPVCSECIFGPADPDECLGNVNLDNLIACYEGTCGISCKN